MFSSLNLLISDSTRDALSFIVLFSSSLLFWKWNSDSNVVTCQSCCRMTLGKVDEYFVRLHWVSTHHYAFGNGTHLYEGFPM